MSGETTQTTYSVPTIRCAGCAEEIEKALNRINGVDSVDVNVPAKTVTVEHGTKITRGHLEAALAEAGFPSA